MTTEKWKTVRLDVIGEYMRVLTPHVPDFAKLTGKQFYTCAAQLSQEQFEYLRSEGYRGNASTSPISGQTIYNFKRPVVSKSGGIITGPEVFGRDMRPFTLQIGHGSRVMLVLEWGPHPAGTNADGSTYKAGFIFWIGAVQVVEHVAFVDVPQENRSLAGEFEQYDQPRQLEGAASQLQAYPATIPSQQLAPQPIQQQPQPVQSNTGQQVPPALTAPPARQVVQPQQPLQPIQAHAAARAIADQRAPQPSQPVQPKPVQPLQPVPQQVQPVQPVPLPKPSATAQDYKQSKDASRVENYFDDDIPF